jgi:HD-GYP domain-containing protein (c-di-GMP phosphodiesterase class II)
MSVTIEATRSKRAESAQRLIGALAAAMRNVTFYAPDHPLVAAALPEAIGALAQLLEGEPEFTIKFVDGEAVVDDRPVLSSMKAMASLIGACSRRSMESLTFRKGITPDELLQLVGVLSTDPKDLLAAGGPSMALERQAVRHIVLERVHEVGQEIQQAADVHGAGLALKPRELYAEAIDVVRNALAEARAGTAIELDAANTTAAHLVDAVLRDSSTVLGLTSVKDYDEYTFTHMLHITLLCLALGHAIGLGHRYLRELGVSALLHDVGKVNVPLEYLRKPGKLLPEEFAAIQRHPVDGGLILNRHPEAPPVAAIVAFEHHMRADLGGYPKVRRARELNLYSLIVSVADVYDALTTQRPYRPPLSPWVALSVMHDLPRGTFEPMLLARFTDILGKYPAGTLLRLSSGELAVVSRPNPSDPARPFARCLREVEGVNALDRQEIDLAETDSATGEYLLSVAEVVHSEECAVNTGELLRDLLAMEAY